LEIRKLKIFFHNLRERLRLRRSFQDRLSQFWESDVQQMEDDVFKKNFRVDRLSFKKICVKLQCISKQDTNFRQCIPLNKRVAIALYALGSSAEYRTIAHLFGVGHSTVMEIVLEFCSAVCDNFKEHISSYPPTLDEIQRVVQGFKLLGFPQCFGAIGNT